MHKPNARKPAIMALLKVATPFNIDLEFMPAGFMKRALAWCCDLLILYVYSYIVIFFILHNITSLSPSAELQFVLMLLFVVLPAMTWHLFFEVFNNGRSPGKLLTGLKVINKEGASPGLGQYLIRWILFLPNYFMLTFITVSTYSPIAFIYITILLALAALPDMICTAISINSQRLGDLAAGTVVVDIHYKMSIDDAIYMDTGSDDYQPSYPQVLKLSDRDINGIHNTLKSPVNKETEAFIQKLTQRIETVLNITMQENDHREFLITLIKDYNSLTQKAQQRSL